MSKAATRNLVSASLCYLSIPFVIFCVGWLKWYWAALMVGLIAVAVVTVIRTLNPVEDSRQIGAMRTTFHLRDACVVLVLSLSLLTLSGIGGYGYQDADWRKHNAVLKDLVDLPWPITYQVDRQTVPLTYYIAFYLPAALIGKAGGWHLANQALFGWSLVGLVLALLWFLALVRGAAASSVALFCAFSGLDIVGRLFVTPLIASGRPELLAGMTWGHLEWWALVWQYSSNITLLFWAPHQALGGWIATGLVLHGFMDGARKLPRLFYLGLVALWSPYVTLGLALYLCADLFAAAIPWRERLGQYLSLPNLCGLLLLTICGLYYSAKLYPLPTGMVARLPQGFVLPLGGPDLARRLGLIVILIAAFCLLEFGLVAFILYRSHRIWDRQTTALFVTTVICLSLLPLFYQGRFNDLVMRASIPALFVLAVLVGRALHEWGLPRLQRLLLVACIAVGLSTPLIEIARHAKHIYEAKTFLSAPSQNQVAGLWALRDQELRRNPGFDSFMAQYVGSAQAPFFRLFADLRAAGQ